MTIRSVLIQSPHHTADERTHLWNSAYCDERSAV